jgi:cytochrome c-type biogenesis protein CcmH/NrfG
MSDRTETLLAELVELHKRHVALAEEALAGQRDSIAQQRLSVERQKLSMDRQAKGLRIMFSALAVVMVLIIGQYAYSWFRYLASR